MQNLNAIVIGATGATGKELIIRLLEDPHFNSVSTFVRKNPEISHTKLKTHKIDFSKIHDYRKLIKGNVLFSCLGTTLKAAGSKAKQYQVDFTFQYKFAKYASDNGVNLYSLVSSTGAKPKSPFFYPKIKGQLEESVKKLPFKTIHIYQPPILIRQDELVRRGEKIVIKALRGLNNLGILKSHKPLLVSTLANRMVDEIINLQQENLKIFSPKDF
ncbi:MAG: hypothetical protein CMC11_03695 [Flavobacteriaceae bacterium]|nr:hypothetical protein [Flavobacteriaceae bacterium]